MPGPFSPGDKVPNPGIYRVIHYQHRLPHLITLSTAIDVFPPCRVCKDRVRFEPRLEVSNFVAPRGAAEIAPNVRSDSDFPAKNGEK